MNVSSTLSDSADQGFLEDRSDFRSMKEKRRDGLPCIVHAHLSIVYNIVDVTANRVAIPDRHIPQAPKESKL
jgi:hypothetical protein